MKDLPLHARRRVELQWRAEAAVVELPRCAPAAVELHGGGWNLVYRGR